MRKFEIFHAKNILGKHIYKLNKLQFLLNILLKASFHYKKENNYFGMSKRKLFNTTKIISKLSFFYSNFFRRIFVKEITICDMCCASKDLSKVSFEVVYQSFPVILWHIKIVRIFVQEMGKYYFMDSACRYCLWATLFCSKMRSRCEFVINLRNV